MPNILASAAVDRVRATIGDDHSNEGAVPPAVVLSFLQSEYDAQWEKMARGGVVPPTTIQTVLLAATELVGLYDFDAEIAPMAIIDVVELLDSTELRPLLPAQPGNGPKPFNSVATADRATHFTVIGQGDTAYVELFPVPSSGTYYVRYVPVAKTLVLEDPAPAQLADDESLSIEGLHSSALDRVILGAARRSLLRVNTSSPMLNELIRQADEDSALHVAGRLHHDRPRIRNVDFRRGWPRRGQDRLDVFNDPQRWHWLF